MKPCGWFDHAYTVAFWRAFTLFFALYYAGMAFVCGLHGSTPAFDGESLISGVFLFSACKSHSQVKRSRRQPPGQ